ncbi:MAG: N-acetylglucosamine-6-phosphate deacetylase [Sedimentisphaerales bacterium]|nr:N-acetylglucosamine-6-phosphate deacetylase [Sedimentisphaerales bacterium]NLZ07442.1 N-acetylglucosamine-6-phosphate deacetylase [Phycisphaerae bacterium]HNY80620.1 N-acetylglucosamine-6-phosphate deacetylase [Sedimentisphaerales bacterium]HOC62960.1 N-acetylglucosamine-6-phosphate deacetylase [Sedimentisphaerales bacterium]HOH66360.1 N-acetylglucosamine-6-phosphate deacetylase [Sedimentisphaerales bacterium]
MASLLIRNCRRYDAPPTDGHSNVLVQDGCIGWIGAGEPPAAPEQVLDAGGRLLAPGFIDVHIQGAGGADVLDATPTALAAIAKACARCGVTSYLATTVYKIGQENRHLEVASECIGRDLGGARLLGIHLEGPFISLRKRGMIQPDCLADPSPSALEAILARTGDGLAMMTVAPELPCGLEVVRALADRGIVASLGHTHATYEQALAGFDAGINHVTHLFNAMPSLHHRDPGPLGAIFERSDVTVQAITDGVHIHPSVLRLAFAALGPSRFVTITDGMQALGLPDGRYVYNGIPYETRNGAARYKDGTLIGTAVGLNQMLARLVNVTGCSEATAIRTATENPASILGLAKKTGAIQAGYDADMVLLEEDFTVYATVVGGRIVYRRESD